MLNISQKPELVGDTEDRVVNEADKGLTGKADSN